MFYCIVSQPAPPAKPRILEIPASRAVAPGSCTSRAQVVHQCFETSEIAALRPIRIPGDPRIPVASRAVASGSCTSRAPVFSSRAPVVHRSCTGRAPVLCDKRDRRTPGHPRILRDPWYQTGKSPGPSRAVAPGSCTRRAPVVHQSCTCALRQAKSPHSGDPRFQIGRFPGCPQSTERLRAGAAARSDVEMIHGEVRVALVAETRAPSERQPLARGVGDGVASARVLRKSSRCARAIPAPSRGTLWAPSHRPHQPEPRTQSHGLRLVGSGGTLRSVLQQHRSPERAAGSPRL